MMDRYWKLCVSVFLAIVVGCQAQGTSCTCSPLDVELLLDFSASCEGFEDLRGQGISNTDCFVDVSPPSSIDLVPVEISSIAILELDSMDQVIAIDRFTGPFFDGDTISFRSVLVSGSGESVASWRIAIGGVNAFGDLVRQAWSIDFNNDCTAFPTLTEGSRIGWTKFISLSAPPSSFCPSVPDTLFPTPAGSLEPSFFASAAPTLLPTTMPSLSVSASPSSAPTTAPILGVDICTCQPAEIEIIIDLSLSCGDSTVQGPGVMNAPCITNGDEPDGLVLDLTPVAITSVQIFEVDKNFEPVSLSTFDEFLYTSGDKLEYRARLVSMDRLATGLQVSLRAVNGAGLRIRQDYAILFTNECEVYPVLLEGQQIGWTTFTALEPPPLAVCPLSSISDSPTMMPSVPSMAPSFLPSHIESIEPTSPLQSFPLLSAAPSLGQASSFGPSLVPTSAILSTSPSEDPEPIVGIDICTCQPSVVEFVLNFSLTCEDDDAASPGIAQTTCKIDAPSSDVVTDLVPVWVNEIQVFEFNQHFFVIGQEIFEDGPYLDGGTVRYTALLHADDDPSIGLQVIVNGFNILGEEIRQTWAILFTNDCDAYPVLIGGQSVGWTVITPLVPPPLEVCLLSPGSRSPTTAPTTSFPSPMPSLIDSRMPTFFASFSPSIHLSAAPTSSSAPTGQGDLLSPPSASPSIVPSTVPTTVPIASPSNLPSQGPSNIPSSTPSAVPSVAPSNMPSIADSARPSQEPTSKVSSMPTGSPSIVVSEEPTIKPTKGKESDEKDKTSEKTKKGKSGKKGKNKGKFRTRYRL